MQRLTTWLYRVVSAENRRLHHDLRVERAARYEVTVRLEQCERIAAVVRRDLDAAQRRLTAGRPAAAAPDGQDGQDVQTLRREVRQLRATCAAMADRLAAYEGRPVQAELPPTRVRRLGTAGEALTEIISQVPGDATAVLDRHRTAVIPAVRDA